MAKLTLEGYIIHVKDALDDGDTTYLVHKVDTGLI